MVQGYAGAGRFTYVQPPPDLSQRDVVGELKDVGWMKWSNTMAQMEIDPDPLDQADTRLRNCFGRAQALRCSCMRKLS